MGGRRGFEAEAMIVVGVAAEEDGFDLQRSTSLDAGNVGQALEELQERAGRADVVVVDPPRAGLAGKALPRTGALQASRIVNVYSIPTTLASDLSWVLDYFG